MDSQNTGYPDRKIHNPKDDYCREEDTNGKLIQDHAVAQRAPNL
jgi:hypothetical protein